MPRGRPRKRTTFNFHIRRCQKETENSSENLEVNSSKSETIAVDFGPNPVSNQDTQSLTCPTRAAKVKCIQFISEIAHSEISYSSSVLRERSQLRRATESSERRVQRLRYLRQRSYQRLASETKEQREQRLEGQRRRYARRRTALEINYLKVHSDSERSLDNQVLADAETYEEEISIKDEPPWIKDEDSPSGDSENSNQETTMKVKKEPVASENSNQEITTKVKKEPVASLLEEPTFVSVKQEPVEYLDEEVVVGKKIKREVMEDS